MRVTNVSSLRRGCGRANGAWPGAAGSARSLRRTHRNYARHPRIGVNISRRSRNRILIVVCLADRPILRIPGIETQALTAGLEVDKVTRRRTDCPMLAQAACRVTGGYEPLLTEPRPKYATQNHLLEMKKRDQLR